LKTRTRDVQNVQYYNYRQQRELKSGRQDEQNQHSMEQYTAEDEDMDPAQRTLLNTAVELLKTNNKQEGEITWEGILEYLELSPSDYLELGRIWREIGAYDEHASLRQQDQFIFLDDLPDFLNAVAGMFALGDTVTKDMIARMAIPVMEFTYGDKVHRSDVTKALFEAKHAIKKSTVRKHLGSQLDQKYKNLIRKIENDYENKWNNQIKKILEECLMEKFPTRSKMSEYIVHNTTTLHEIESL